MKKVSYKLRSGQTFVVEYDENMPCKVCGQPVIVASVESADVCPWCACSIHRNGRDWTFEETLKFFQREPQNYQMKIKEDR